VIGARTSYVYGEPGGEESLIREFLAGVEGNHDLRARALRTGEGHGRTGRLQSMSSRPGNHGDDPMETAKQKLIECAARGDRRDPRSRVRRDGCGSRRARRAEIAWAARWFADELADVQPMGDTRRIIRDMHMRRMHEGYPRRLVRRAHKRALRRRFHRRADAF